MFKALLVELKGFKYQITLAVLLSQAKNSDEIEYSPAYFNSLTKTVINNKYKLNQSFQEIIDRLENWISNGYGWIVKEIISQFLNLNSYLPLSGSTYIKLPVELQHPMKGLINIKNNVNKCFMWCHVRNLNLVDKNQQRITKKDREVVKKLNYSSVDFPVSKKDYSKIEVLNKICVNVFCFSSENVLIKHKEDCLIINGKQNVKLEKGFIEFKNFNKQIPVPFKIYADFECLLKSIDCGFDNDWFSYTKKYGDHIPCSFAYKIVCVDNKFSKDVVLYRGKNEVLNL